MFIIFSVFNKFSVFANYSLSKMTPNIDEVTDNLKQLIAQMDKRQVQMNGFAQNAQALEKDIKLSQEVCYKEQLYQIILIFLFSSTVKYSF